MIPSVRIDVAITLPINEYPYGDGREQQGCQRASLFSVAKLLVEVTIEFVTPPVENEEMNVNLTL